MTKEITLSQGKVAVVDDEDYEFLSQWKWSAARGGKPGGPTIWWAVRVVASKGKQRAILMSRVIANPQPTEVVTHVNGDGLDYRRVNLVSCPRRKMVLGRRGSHKTSRYKGVYWQKDIGRWRARFRLKYLGTFTDEEEAARVYDRAAEAFDPKHARLNFAQGG